MDRDAVQSGRYIRNLRRKCCLLHQRQNTAALRVIISYKKEKEKEKGGNETETKIKVTASKHAKELA
jgi:hypothetical protein